MDIDQIISSLSEASKTKYVKFITDKGRNSCETCLQYNNQIFAEDDSLKPELPIHPNCRCRYETVTNPTVEKIKARLLQMANQLLEYAKQARDKALQLIEEAKALLQKVKMVKSKAEKMLLLAKIAALIIVIQGVVFTIEKIKNAIDSLEKAMAEFGLQFVNPITAIRDFDKNLAEIKDILKELHHARLNEPDQDKDVLPKSPEEAIKRGFIEAPDKQNRYHRNKGQSGNKKYYHPITGQEVIFDEHGKIVTLPENTGTKNYGADPVSPGHVIYDVLPYWIWGNSEKDTTPFWDRVWGSGNSPL